MPDNNNKELKRLTRAFAARRGNQEREQPPLQFKGYDLTFDGGFPMPKKRRRVLYKLHVSLFLANFSNKRIYDSTAQNANLAMFDALQIAVNLCAQFPIVERFEIEVKSK